MGCGPSRASSLNNLDDSRHMKLSQKKGQAPPAFKPRAEDIMVKPKAISTNTNTDIVVGLAAGLIIKHIQKKMITINNGDCCEKNKEYRMGHIMMASQVQLA